MLDKELPGTGHSAATVEKILPEQRPVKPKLNLQLIVFVCLSGSFRSVDDSKKTREIA